MWQICTFIQVSQKTLQLLLEYYNVGISLRLMSAILG